MCRIPARPCNETIQAIRTQVANTPQVQDWLAEHPDDPQTLLFQDLVSLGQRLQGQLVPLGIARPDWRENASVLAGTEEEEVNSQFELGNETNLVNNLLSWRTAIPRVAHDNIAAILLQHGGEMWFLRTNQVGGADPAILPLAPTELFGDFVVIPVAFFPIDRVPEVPQLGRSGNDGVGTGNLCVLFVFPVARAGSRDDLASLLEISPWGFAYPGPLAGAGVPCPASTPPHRRGAANHSVDLVGDQSGGYSWPIVGFG